MDYKDVNAKRYEEVCFNEVENNIYAAINPIGNYAFLIGYKTIRWFLKYLHRFSGKRIADLKILDIGCGDGHISRMVVSLLENACNVYGFDFSSNNVEHCKKLNASVQYKIGDVVKGIPFNDVKFDGVLCFVVLSHLRQDQDVKRALYNIYNSLEEDGLFLWYELVSKSHFINMEKDTQGFNSKEIAKYALGAGFEEIASRSFSRTIWLGKHSRSIYYYANEHNIWFLELLAKILPLRPTILIRIYKKIEK